MNNLTPNRVPTHEVTTAIISCNEREFEKVTSAKYAEGYRVSQMQTMPATGVGSVGRIVIVFERPLPVVVDDIQDTTPKKNEIDHIVREIEQALVEGRRPGS